MGNSKVDLKRCFRKGQKTPQAAFIAHKRFPSCWPSGALAFSLLCREEALGPVALAGLRFGATFADSECVIRRLFGIYLPFDLLMLPWRPLQTLRKIAPS